VPFPVDEARIAEAERELGRRLPIDLRKRLMRDNGGDLTAMPVREAQDEDFDPYWELHPVSDGSDRRRAARTASHILREAAEAGSWPGFPDGAIPFAHNGTGDRLLIASDSDDILYWNHEDGSTLRVRVWWD
jgi:hypothetical protein